MKVMVHTKRPMCVGHVCTTLAWVRDRGQRSDEVHEWSRAGWPCAGQSLQKTTTSKEMIVGTRGIPYPLGWNSRKARSGVYIRSKNFCTRNKHSSRFFDIRISDGQREYCLLCGPMRLAAMRGARPHSFPRQVFLPPFGELSTAPWAE